MIFYTLQAKTDDPMKPEYYNNGEKFPTYEEAYDKMCALYFEEQKVSYKNPTGVPKRYGIFRTTISEYNGNTNSMTQPVWAA